MTPRDVTIIIPAHNEELGIEPTLKYLASLAGEFEVIVVDDGSSDRTAEIAETFGARVIKHRENKGVGAAVKTGVLQASNDIVVIMDADGQHNPGDIPRLLSEMKDCDMVVGAREKGSHRIWHRELGKNFIRSVASYLVNKRILDPFSGFRAVRRQRVMEFLHILPSGYSYCVTLTMALIKAGYDVAFVPITAQKRIGGKSDVNLVQDGVKSLLLVFRVIMLFNPLKIFIPASLTLMAIGGVYGLWEIYKFMHIPGGAVLTLVSSIVIFCFGLLADQMAAINRRGQ